VKKRYILILLIIVVLGTLVLLSPKKSKKTFAVGASLVDVVKTLGENNTSVTIGGSGVYKTNIDDTTGLYHDYRYIGPNANNYVKFNNDLYRIIGVFDEQTHGVTGQLLTKITRSRPIASHSWGIYHTNNLDNEFGGYSVDWTGEKNIDDPSDDTSPANINVLLNEYFYKKTYNSSKYGDCENWTYYNYVESTSTPFRTNDCSDIVGYGIDSKYRNYIQNVVWYLRSGVGSPVQSIKSIYECERGLLSSNLNCVTGNNNQYSARIIAPIGLPYLSDVYYSSSFSSDYTYDFGNDIYNLFGLGSDSWMFYGAQWTISHRVDQPVHLTYTGDANYSKSYFSFPFSPTFYLKSTIYVIGGSGKYDDPYIISCDDCDI